MLKLLLYYSSSVIAVDGAIVIGIPTTSLTPPPLGYTDNIPLNLYLPSLPVGVKVVPDSFPPNQTAYSYSLPSNAFNFL